MACTLSQLTTPNDGFRHSAVEFQKMAARFPLANLFFTVVINVTALSNAERGACLNNVFAYVSASLHTERQKRPVKRPTAVIRGRPSAGTQFIHSLGLVDGVCLLLNEVVNGTPRRDMVFTLRWK
ncbi:unnamed protein product [Soboliphyme baturini]|uniref:Uncharacterized protein n=1 Tax=Soboliphyme baturini TaxID=241478 RepID=A0A183ILL8_9BILA|nr:unnamed protein product [Soboliphyme baturini]